MIISCERVRALIQENVKGAGEGMDFVRLVDLTWLAMLVSEVAFQCPPAQRKEKRRKMLDFVTSPLAAVGDLLAKARGYETLSTFTVSRQRVALEDLVMIRILFDAYAVRIGDRAQQTLSEWVEEAWHWGVCQQEALMSGAVSTFLHERGLVSLFATRLLEFK